MSNDFVLSRLLGFDISQDPDHWTPSFCVLLESISNKIPIDSILLRTANGGANLLHHRIRPEFQNWLYLDFFDPHAHADDLSLSSMRLKADMAISILAMCLRHELREGNIITPWNSLAQHNAYERDEPVPIPTALDIPFHTMMDLPLPFTPEAAEKFTSCHLERMATPDFLEDGEWVGYYSAFSGRITKPPKFDPPMHRIRFSVTRHNTKPKETLILTGKGVDRVGPFHLRGTLSVGTGHLVMGKEYQNVDIYWDWRGILTPHGIVANWGHRNGGGWVWLWKASWTNSQT